MTLTEINACDREQFVRAVGSVFDAAPWAAERAWNRRPFANFDDLFTKLIQAVQAASADEQLALLQNSVQKPFRSGVGVSDLAEKYRKKFGFPFIYAVKEDASARIAEALNRRLKSTAEQEFQVALGNVFRIARFRLEESLTTDASHLPGFP